MSLEDLSEIRNAILEAKEKKLTLSFSRNVNPSNTMRKGLYKNNACKIDLTDFNRVLKVDEKLKTALVEPGVTMKHLFDELYASGFAPKVLPEFQGITVGGAVNGAALESSSFRFGQFNNCCKAHTLMTGDGEIRKLSKESNDDLYHAISGSYGSLGLLLNSTIEIEKAKPFVEISYHRFNTIKNALRFMSESITTNFSEFIEGLVFSSDNILVVTGDKKDKPDAKAPFLSLKRYYSPWFYQHLYQKSADRIEKETMSLKDYLFRHDRAAFWMGGYALHPKVLSAYILELIKIKRNALTTEDHFKPALLTPFWFRFLFGGLMGSKRLYKFLHQDTEEWFANHFCIQDYYLPISKTEVFIQHVLEKSEIVPLWLCPIKKSSQKELFSPSYQPLHEDEHLVDVGVYGMVKPPQSGKEVSRELDLFCNNLYGRKMLYSYSYLSEEEFWQIYSKNNYDNLRKKYHAEGLFIDIQKKVLEH